MEFFGIGWMEMLVIGLVALVVVGPKQLPQAAQTIGRFIGYASRQWHNIQEQIRQPVENEMIDLKGKVEDAVHDITDLEPLSEKNIKKTDKNTSKTH